MRKWLAGLAVAAALGGCGAPGSSSSRPCSIGSPNLMVALFFGRAMPDGSEVGEQDWRRFVDRVVARDLPDGFTVLDASGAWLSPASHATRNEPTKLLLVSLPATPAALARVQRVRAAYQRRFHQQLVGMSVQPGCGDF